MDSSRRSFIKNASLVSLGFVGLNHYAINAATGLFDTADLSIGFGPLSHQNGDTLSLPKGFSSRIISRKGQLMNDGLLVPGMYDGMGSFSTGSGKTILIRNHENSPGADLLGPFGEKNGLIHKINKSKIYDFGHGKDTCVGGTTTVVYNEKTQKVESQYLSLIGTVRNCAGGITPWQSWITCEESSLKISDGLEKDHGFTFEVPATEKIGITDPHPIKAMGRFTHEAVAVQPKTGIVYQTEDEGDSLFYRYLPNTYGKLHNGGKLQCLVIKEWKSADTRNYANLTTNHFPEKKSFEVEWMDLAHVEAPDSDLRLRGFKLGAARFSRGEGIWYGKNELFFACTDGGKNRKGQIFKYTPSKFEGTPEEKKAPGVIELFLEPNNVETFQNCDNLTIAPWGDVVICEDKKDPRVIGITPEGKTYVIAKNVGFPNSEFAGPVFSPSGNTLFINIQTPGVTLAINGPWKNIRKKG
ncbi:alkaline phosphatase PhoX [Pedobacter nyackensis]|uniref:alkaline phosphatase PhoX n=1 Tax=Pedobacter nyackensis TaxID=475255 RepID=UPI002930A42B|nr:alkaline phosphatase PhoX [Pedobacter nyackensis]